jgi:predicted Zn-dependent protease
MQPSADSSSYLKPRRNRRIGLLLACALVLACHTTPVTGRRSLNAFSQADDIQLGNEAYEQVLAEAKLVTAGPERDMVVRAMTRLSAVSDDAGYEWEVSLIDDDAQVNAFALPGGKMAVYTGLLPVAETETGLAVVMGHEIAHVIARHGTERMTSSLGLETLLSFANIGDYASLASAGLEFLVNRPFGRSQESEADEIGLVYMARAGYDPREAVAFWERMEQLSSGGGGPEFLSTHPAHETRVERLKEKLPEAMEIWRAAGGGGSM